MQKECITTPTGERRELVDCAYNAFVQLVLATEGEARALLTQIKTSTGQVVVEEDVFEMAQVIALSKWNQGPLPPQARIFDDRHELRGKLNALVLEARTLIKDGPKNVPMYHKMLSLNEKVVSILDGAPQEPAEWERRAHEIRVEKPNKKQYRSPTIGGYGKF